MKKFQVLPVLLCLSAMLILNSCAGYQLGSSKPAKLANVNKLAIPTFKNDTLEPRLEVLTTNALIKKVQMDGAYQVVPRDEADAVLVCTIQNIRRNPFRTARFNTLRTSELQMQILVQYKVEDLNGTALLSGVAVGTSNIVVDPNAQLSERQALADAAEKLSTDLASAISEGW